MRHEDDTVLEHRQSLGMTWLADGGRTRHTAQWRIRPTWQGQAAGGAFLGLHSRQ